MSEDKTWIVVLNDGETWTTMDGCSAYLVPTNKLDELASNEEEIHQYPGCEISIPEEAPDAFAPKGEGWARPRLDYEFGLRKIPDKYEIVQQKLEEQQLWRDIFLRILDLVGGTAVSDDRFFENFEDKPTVIESAAKIADEAVKEILKRERDE